ncbi:bacteriocin immunity protein [Pseudomonas sp. A34-9]|uniref:bacteriocin immunity protein n=1 Tax=Pseudomonas sp. A34-9 TaxID=3034675 RepID=UPI00240E9976|nr:bacteriocin immunity protein [Pseudomonas sp. A34-9]
MNVKNSLSEYSKAELIELINTIKNDEGSINYQLALVMHFKRLVKHPASSDLIFFPENGADDSAEGICQTIKDHCLTNGLRAFTD